MLSCPTYAISHFSLQFHEMVIFLITRFPTNLSISANYLILSQPIIPYYLIFPPPKLILGDSIYPQIYVLYLIFITFLHKCTFWAKFFSTWKRVNCGKISQKFQKILTISPHDNFFSTNIVSDICDKYELSVTCFFLLSSVEPQREARSSDDPV